jgi:hypothetical protein
LAREWARELSSRFKIDSIDDDFVGVMQQIQRQRLADCTELIREKVGSSKVNWAHLALAQLLSAGWVDVVASVNFDPLVEKACAFAGFHGLAVHDLATSHSFVGEKLTYPSLMYLHGRASGFVQKILATETMENPQAEELFRHGASWSWIVIGYAGVSDQLLKVFLKYGKKDMYWYRYNNAPLPEPLDAPGQSIATIIETSEGADEYLMRTCAQLGCDIPALFWRPWNLCRSLVREVRAFPVEDHDVLEYSRAKLPAPGFGRAEEDAFRELALAGILGSPALETVRRNAEIIRRDAWLESLADKLLIREARLELAAARADHKLNPSYFQPTDGSFQSGPNGWVTSKERARTVLADVSASGSQDSEVGRIRRGLLELVAESVAPLEAVAGQPSVAAPEAGLETQIVGSGAEPLSAAFASEPVDLTKP